MDSMGKETKTAVREVDLEGLTEESNGQGQELSGLDSSAPAVMAGVMVESPQRTPPAATTSRQAIHQVVGKLLLDPGFRDLFVQDPHMAVENAGIALTPYEYSVAEKISRKLLEYAELPDVKKLAEQMNFYRDRVYVDPT